MAEDVFLLRIPGIARFLLIRGCEIVVDVNPLADLQDVAAFLTGAVFGILLHQRSCVVLQASAVSVNGKAVLFCGPSGAGKSTLAAALTQHGYCLLADEVCAIELKCDGLALAQPDGNLIKLWADANAP